MEWSGMEWKVMEFNGMELTLVAWNCLVYTSDAAAELTRVDLGDETFGQLENPTLYTSHRYHSTKIILLIYIIINRRSRRYKV